MHRVQISIALKSGRTFVVPDDTSGVCVNMETKLECYYYTYRTNMMFGPLLESKEEIESYRDSDLFFHFVHHVGFNDYWLIIDLRCVDNPLELLCGEGSPTSFAWPCEPQKHLNHRFCGCDGGERSERSFWCVIDQREGKDVFWKRFSPWVCPVHAPESCCWEDYNHDSGIYLKPKNTL
ncbi:hypothetical protein [Crucivirus-540]|nr:hypothetical protein [Crucivirus-540]